MAEPLKYTSEGVPKNWNGKDWQQYKWVMMIVFRKKKLVEIVEGNIERSSLTSSEAEDDFDDKQLTIMQIIGMSLPADIFHQVRDKTTGTDMWKALCVIYESRANKTTMAHRAESIRHELEMIKLSPGGDVNKHLSKMFNLRTELLSLNYQFDDVAMVELMLNSLPHQYEFESLKSGVRYNSADNFITPERTRELIRVADSRQKAYQAKSGTGQRGSQKIGATGGAGSKGKTENGEDQQLGGKSKDTKKKRLKKCFICGSTEHLRAECPDRVEGNHGGGANANEQKRKPRANMTTRHDASRELDSSSENDDLGEATSRLDALIIDAGLAADSSDDEGLVTSEEEVREESDSHAHVGWWYDGQDHDEDEVNTSSGWWYFDTAANVHVTGNPWYYVAFTPDPSQSQHIQGVTAALASRIAGVGTVALITMVDGEQATVILNDVFYVPGATHGLFSIGLAAEQGFDFDYDRQSRDFRVRDEGRTVIVASPHEATWGFQVTHPSIGDYIGPQDQPLSNFTAAEGVASLKLWHERLGHTCPQYLKMMVDKELVRGMLMKQRDLGACDACHIGKQKKKPHAKKLERNTKAPNQVVYADLLIPSKDNGTRFEAVLVIMDGFSRFVTVHMLTSKSSEVVNRHIKEYVLWAERQAGRHKVRQVLTRTLHVKYKVRQILTDKGGEFVNGEMESWYKAHGIEHVLVGPKSSQLNLCERTHQSLVEMMKASMHDAGFPKSLWPEALRNAVYIKNRIYNKGTGGVPYEMLFGVKPDLHHMRKFGALAYVHVPVTPGRKKHHANARLGFVLGYAEDVIGCKVYFPDNRTAKFVSDLRVAEDVTYRDRHELTVEDVDLESLHFVQSGEIVEDDDAVSTLYESTMELEAGGITAAAPTVNETMAGPTVDLEGGEMDGGSSAAPNAVPSAAPIAVPTGVLSGAHSEEAVGDLSVLPSDSGRSRTASREAPRAFSASSLVDVGGVTAALPSDPAEIRSTQTEMQCQLDDLQSESLSELLAGSQDDHPRDDTEPEQHSSVRSSPGTMSPTSEYDVAAVSDVASCDGSEPVAGQCGSEVGDTEELADGTVVAEEDELEDEEATTVASVCGQLMGKRQRDETPSEEIRVEQSAERQEPKRTRRPGLREYHERRRPAYLRDYVMNVTQNSSRVLDKNGRPIRGSDVRIPRNRREARRSKYREFFIRAELDEMAAMRAQHVLEEIAIEDVPKDAKPIKTRFVYDIKTDHQGYVIRFKARLVALGNCQRPGIDFGDTFSPVARMSSFRLMVGLAGALNLTLYGGDINTAYLNAKLGIRQYVRSIEGFPCEVDGHIYVVVKALYGLRQSGREWNTELNRWLLERGYQRSLTEPCLYYRVEGEEIMLVLVYVDDILVATKDEEQKKKLFEDLDKEYGLKDQGLLTEYLGVEVEQTADHIFISQSKYAQEILVKFGYAEAHSVGNPMEVNARLVPLGDGEGSDTSFPYREAVDMLMYLATSTRPDLAFALSQLSRFVAKPSSKHVGALKRVLRYLAGTVNYGITYDRQSGESDTVVLEGYCDSDWANDPETRRSTTGFVFTLAGGAVSWMSRRQSIVALSTAEAEYVAACEATMEAVAESNILQEILPQKCLKLRIGIDNQAAHIMATNPTYSRRTRHIELRWHFVREQVERGVIELHKIRGDVNPADTFTKPLDKLRLQNMLGLAGIGGAK